MLDLATVPRSRIGYYFGPEAPGQVPTGRWLGHSAEALGLAGRAVERPALDAQLGGVDPLTGVILDPHHDRDRIAAFDCMVSTPKSVSLLYPLGGPVTSERVRRSHDASLEATIEYLERHAAGVRRRSHPGRRVPAQGLIAAAFGHETSRANDPHLHRHVLVANLASDRAGRWSGLDSMRLYASRPVADALYLCQLRYELSQRLDVAFRQRAHGGLDLVGLSDGVLSAFPQRGRQIEAERARISPGPRAKRIAIALTRPPKDASLEAGLRREHWWERAYRLGVSESRLAAIAPPEPVRGGRSTTASWSEETVREVIAAMPGAFTRHNALRAAALALVDGAPLAELERTMERALDAVAVGDPEHPSSPNVHGGATADASPPAPPRAVVRRRGPGSWCPRPRRRSTRARAAGAFTPGAEHGRAWVRSRGPARRGARDRALSAWRVERWRG